MSDSCHEFIPTANGNVALARMPNCIYIGTSKAGSTWIFDLLAKHPDVFVTPAKGIYFFDTKIERGLDWYASHFAAAEQQAIVAEVSHSYLYSAQAPARIAAHCPDVQLMACLREPVERAFSDYLDYVKNGRFEGSFEEACQAIPSIIDRGRYATHLRPYIEEFGRARIHVAVFDELSTSPDTFASEIYRFLRIEEKTLQVAMKKKMMPAGRPRSQVAMRFTKSISKQLKRIGLKQITGRVKRSRAARNLLYQAYSADNKPVITESSKATLREVYASEIQEMDQLLGMDFQQRWQYA